IGARRSGRSQLERAPPVCRRRRIVAFLGEKASQHLAHVGFVLDKQDHAAAAGTLCRFVMVQRLRLYGLPPSERHFNRENRSLPETRADVDGMAQQIRQALHDGEAEAEASVALSGGIVELVKLLEDRLKLPFRDSRPGIPYLDAQRVAAPAATEQ